MEIKVLQVKQVGGFDVKSYVRIVSIPNDKITKDVYNTLELVFEFGQNDFQPMQSPSVSVGDVAVIGDKFYVCEPFCWSLIEEAVEEVKPIEAPTTEGLKLYRDYTTYCHAVGKTPLGYYDKTWAYYYSKFVQAKKKLFKVEGY